MQWVFETTTEFEVEVIWHCTAGGQAEIEILLARRTPLDEAVGELIVDTDDVPPDALAERILPGLALVPRAGAP